VSTGPATVLRQRLDLPAEPLDVLRRLRGQHRVVALLGDWATGDVLSFDPLHVQGPDDDPFDLPVPDVEPDGGPDGEGFAGGWIGVWGYQLGRRVERLGPPPPRPVPLPDHRIGFYDRVVRRRDGAWWLEQLTGLVDPDEQERRAARFLDVLRRGSRTRPVRVGRMTMTPSPAEHRAAVQRVREHVAAGDVFQVNLTARLEGSFAGEPLDLFARGVEALRPAYAAFVDAPEGAAVSLSPELFLRRTGGHVLTSPIKGTAPLSADPDALVASAKDRAENVMIVDLMRNDLGRVAEPGTVHVPALLRAERHAVWHLVSDVVATLPPGTSPGALLRATFPPGSVTGAPKVRAMELIDEIEPTAREAYTGALGRVGPGGLELNVAIRTFEVARGRVWLGVGGGVVHDSDPAAEYAECLVKARPLVEAVGGSLAPEPPVRTERPSVPVTPPPPWRADVAQGVFETALVVDGRVRHLDEHLARLTASVERLWGVTPGPEVAASVRARAAGLAGEHRLRVDVRPEGRRVDVSVSAQPLTGTVPAWVLTPRTVPGGLGAHKWADRSALRAPGAPERDDLVVDADGSVLEAGRAALALVRDDGVHVPLLDGRLLPSTARARLLARLHRAGVPVHERRLTLADVADASEVLVTNALRGVVPVVQVDGVGRWAPGPMAAALARPDPEPAAAPDPAVAGARVLVVDNYDSFVYNLVQHVRELGAATTVVRHDRDRLDDLVAAAHDGTFTHLLVSPGPGAPADAGLSVELVRRVGHRLPTLGVCLGHQAIAEAYGATVRRAPDVVHGKASLVHHDGRGVHAGLPDPLVVGRYHSLAVDESTLPAALEVTSRTPSGIVMGLRHRDHPVEGVQWHPESVLSPDGRRVLTRFLASRGRRA
jgi:para-aminobenzoate synthetase/4-amino-4-deoxychorismate lyase